MNLELFIVTVFVAMLALGFIFSVVDVIGASLYDIKELKRAKKRHKDLKGKESSYQPLVSIIIPAFNETAVIERCLESVIASSYEKIQVIVSDDASKDKTSKIVRNFIKNQKTKTTKIELLTNRKNRGRGGAINNAIRRRAKGDLIMALDADCTLEKDSIKNAVTYFENDSLAALAANVRIMPYLSILGVLQQFEWVAAFRSKKLNSYMNCEYIVGGAGAMYRRSVIKKLGYFNENMLTEDIALSLSIAKLGNKENELRYASDVDVMTEHVPTYRALFKQRYRWKLGMLQALFASKSLVFSSDKKYTFTLTRYRLPLALWGELMLLLEPLLLTYFVYLAIVVNTPIMFVVSWIAMTTMFFFAVWGDDRLSRSEKIRMTVFLPVMYLLYYVLSIIQILAMFKSLVNYKKITGKEVIAGKWVSPVRIGQSHGQAS